MDFSVQQYIENLNRLYVTGNAREHSYRGDLQRLLASVLPQDILVTNEPARVECGAPDYVLTKGKANIPVGYIEAKDVNVDLSKEGKVYINETQYFDNVPELAWNFYIGGYQPAQKWLKDRKDRELDFDDVLHYQKMIVALTETDRLMKEIDKVLEI